MGEPVGEPVGEHVGERVGEPVGETWFGEHLERGLGLLFYP